MNKMFFLGLTSMFGLASCSNHEVDEVLSPKVDYDDYELICVEIETKNQVTDTLFINPAGGDYKYELSLRRKIIEDGHFNGKYDYADADEVLVSCADKAFKSSLTGGEGELYRRR